MYRSIYLNEICKMSLKFGANTMTLVSSVPELVNFHPAPAPTHKGKPAPAPALALIKKKGGAELKERKFCKKFFNSLNKDVNGENFVLKFINLKREKNDQSCKTKWRNS